MATTMVSFLYKELLSLLLAVLSFVLSACAETRAFPLSLSTESGAGTLSCPSVLNGFYQLESSVQPGGGWGTYPVTGALMAASSTQLNVTTMLSDPQRYFRCVYLGVTNASSKPTMEFNVIQSFSRAGASVDPITGTSVGADTPNTWTVKLPVWAAGKGLNRLSGTNFVVGVSRNGTLYGTPNVGGQTALVISTNQGATWNYIATVPKQNAFDNISSIVTIPFGANELLFASMRQGGLFLSTNQGVSFSKNLLPAWYAALAPRALFHDNLLVEAVAGKSIEDCRLLLCLYGQRLEGSYQIGTLHVFRTDMTLGQMNGGGAPQLQLVWKQDFFDYFARHVDKAIVVSNHVGTVSATTNTFTDSSVVFGTNDTTRPRCLRITSGAGVGQSRMIASNTPSTLSIYPPWQVLPDATSDYQIIRGGLVGAGMHLHCATWVPRSCNGDSNVLFLSFGDKDSKHVCRIPNLDQLGASTNGEDYTGSGWNYSDAQVFAVGHQPTTIWAGDSGQIYFLARDDDGSILASPDDVFNPRYVFEDTFNAFGSPYGGVGYDSFVGSNRVAIVANVLEGTVGQNGIYLGDPTDKQQMFRFARGYSPSSSSSYVGFTMVFGNSRSDHVVVAGDAFGGGQLTNTWFMRLPNLTNIQTVLVANSSSNLIANADFIANTGSLPTNWYLSASAPASSMVYNGSNIYGNGWAWQVSQTNCSNSTSFDARMQLSSFPPARPLCLAFPYRLANYSNSTYFPPAAFIIEWRSPTTALRLDPVSGMAMASTNQWHVGHCITFPPTNATQAKFRYQFKGLCGAVEVAMPSANWARYAVPTAGYRNADVLAHAVASNQWSGCLSSHVEFLVLPLWPTDLNPFAEETVCSILSDDGLRCLLTWDYTLGFRAFFQDNTGRQLAVLKLGQLRTLTRFDPCRFSVDCQQSILTVKLDAGGDVLQAIGIVPAINSFKPVKIRLGGDQFSSSSLGWEGYYALLSCAGSY